MRASSPSRVFLDTNILVYSYINIGPKTAKAVEILSNGGVISVQVLNEFAAVVRRKARLDWEQVQRLTTRVKLICDAVEPLTLQRHEKAMNLAERYGYTIYDANILASALHAGCTTLYSEDMQDGQQIENLTLRNPFTAALL